MKSFFTFFQRFFLILYIRSGYGVMSTDIGIQSFPCKVPFIMGFCKNFIKIFIINAIYLIYLLFI